MKKSYTCLISLLMAASSAQAATTPARCHVTVRTTHKNGDHFEQHYDLHLPTREACQKAAKKHETNFNPKVTQDVKVDFEWK